MSETAAWLYTGGSSCPSSSDTFSATKSTEKVSQTRPISVAPVIALAQSIGRWGDFFNEEAHGGPNRSSLGADHRRYRLSPHLSLYESAWCLLSLHIFECTGRHSQEKVQRSDNMPSRASSYSAERFLVEGLRTDSLMIGPLRQAPGNDKSGHNSRVRRDLFHTKKTKQIFKIKEIFNEIRYRRVCLDAGKKYFIQTLLQRPEAEAANYPFCTIEPNVGVVTVPDERRKVLHETYRLKENHLHHYRVL